MAKSDLLYISKGEIFDDSIELSLADLCQICQLPAERVFELVEEGVIDPVGREPARWHFRAIAVQRVRCAQRLRHDLGINTAGAALALELMEELERLRARLRRLER